MICERKQKFRGWCHKRISLIIALFLIIVGVLLPSGVLCSGEHVVLRDVDASFTAPKWTGAASTVINENIPSFTKKEKTSVKEYTKYSKLDMYGRARVAKACLGEKTINNGERGSIGYIKPSGWNQEKYYGVIDSKPPYLYNRGHLLMQAAAAGINTELCNSERNLITMTRYCNIDGMLPYETRILEYIRNTDNHVFYRVTPIYKGKELVARGVNLEAYSIEDKGEGICFNVYCYNRQPGIKISYADGSSKKRDDYKDEMILAVKNGATTVDIENLEQEDEPSDDTGEEDHCELHIYVLNTNTKRFHYETCRSVPTILDKNKRIGEYYRQDLIDQGYKPCGNCNP